MATSKSIMMNTSKIPILIKIFVFVKNFCNRFFKCKTYHIEQAFIGILLVGIALLSGKGLVEWIGVLAVWLNFGHISVADRLREAEELRHSRKEKVTVECYKKLDYYYFAKELFWFLYFGLLHAYSALVGIFIFLLYRPWRNYYRRYFPKSE